MRHRRAAWAKVRPSNTERIVTLRWFGTLALCLAFTQAARAAPAPVVVELFTSQGCSSCPPADALLAEIVRTRPDVLALGLHVTYWDRLGWRAPFSLPAATARQRSYAALVRDGAIYTPQLVAGGRHQAIGSDRGAVTAAISAARATAGQVTLTLTLVATAGPAADPTAVTLSAGPGTGAGTLWLIGYDPQHVTPVRGGENGGRTLTEANVVRAMMPAGAWTGTAAVFRAPRPAGERVAALLQADDNRIVGTALPAPP